MKTIKLILLYILQFVVTIFIISFISFKIGISLKHVIKNSNVVFTLFCCVFLLGVLIFYGHVYKAIYHKFNEKISDDGVFMIIRKQFFSFTFTIDVFDRDESIKLLTDAINNKRGIIFESNNKQEINYFYFIYKLKKLPYFIKKNDFVDILKITKNETVLDKHFLTELRKEKIKILFDEE